MDSVRDSRRDSRRDYGADPFDFTGDAHILFTAPFYPDADALADRPRYALPADGVLDAEGRLVPADRWSDDFWSGPISEGSSAIEVVTQFAGSEPFTAALTTLLELETAVPLTASIAGMLLPDGYGSVAIIVTVPDGWTENREGLLAGFGPGGGREARWREFRDLLLPALSKLSASCCPTGHYKTIIPYLNATYAGSTTHPWPGRATLRDEYRDLIFPRTPAPIRSESPWASEFYCPGTGFSILASEDPKPTLGKLEVLLLHLDVLYARMDNSAAAADQVIRTVGHHKKVDDLIAAEYRLRSDYHALVQPTFTYDAHVTQLRDALLSAWDTDKNSARAEALLDMARQAVERRIVQEQRRHAARLAMVVTILTILSAIGSIDAAVDLWSRFVK
jgi:hypothetical protein